MILKGYLLTYTYIACILILTTLLSKTFNVNKLITRKITHILITFTFIIMFAHFKYSIHLIIPPFTFIILNYFSYKLNIFKEIENNNTLGTVYYPISVFIMALLTYFNNNLIAGYAIGFFCMGLGDGLAPLFAKYIKSKIIINNKTIVGFLVVLVTSFLVVAYFNHYFNLDYNLFKIMVISISSALIELLSKKGLDNLFLPLGIFLIVNFLGVV